MIIIPKIFNLYSKARPKWQQWYDRRLRLLCMLPPPFWWRPEDQELLVGVHGPMPADIQRSVSAFPYGTTAAAGAAGGGVGTLTLNNLNAAGSDPFIGVATISFTPSGNVEENGVPQNASVEYTDSTNPTVGNDCQCRMQRTGGSTTPTYSSGWSNNAYIVISAERTATLSTASGTVTSSGTAYVRETANTSNEVSASFFMTATVTGGGIFL